MTHFFKTNQSWIILILEAIFFIFLILFGRYEFMKFSGVYNLVRKQSNLYELLQSIVNFPFSFVFPINKKIYKYGHVPKALAAVFQLRQRCLDKMVMQNGAPCNTKQVKLLGRHIGSAAAAGRAACLVASIPHHHLSNKEGRYQLTDAPLARCFT